MTKWKVWLAAIAAVIVGAFIVPQAANASVPNCNDVQSTGAMGWTRSHYAFDNATNDPVTYIQTTGNVTCNIVAWHLFDRFNNAAGFENVYAWFTKSNGDEFSGPDHRMNLNSNTVVTIATSVLPHTKVALAIDESDDNPSGDYYCVSSAPYDCTIIWKW